MIGGQIIAANAPTMAERDMLQSRVAAIDAVLAPGDPRNMTAPILKCFVALASRSGDGMDLQTRAAVFAQVLQGSSQWAVEQACADFCDGRAGDGKWAPTAAEINQRVGVLVSPWQIERKRIVDVLEAKVVDKPDKETRSESVARVRAEWSLGDAVTAAQRERA